MSGRSTTGSAARCCSRRAVCPKLLLHHGDPVGVVRIDVAGRVAALRRVAVRADAQRQGHGRALLTLAEGFARHSGCTRLISCVAIDAVGFYRRFGFVIDRDNVTEQCGRGSVFMIKEVA